jgi:serine/threonine-protein kinase
VDPDHNERTVIERRDALVGEVFDRRFRIEARLAAGGFGAIYRATHIRSGHQLALKVLHAKLTSDSGVVARFRREGAALTRLRDPHTITAYELGQAPDGTLYIVMELLHGESLYDRFRTRGPLPWQRMMAIAREVCSSLGEAHALGIIHRDLKPTNIHLEPAGGGDEFVKVLDFGIAKIVQDSDIDNTELTHAGQMIGTLDYMSPEQMVGGQCDATSDIYTLGVVMYEMMAGHKPFDDANSAAAALAAVLTTTPPRLAVQAIVPADVDRIVMRCLERQPSDRYQSATELAAALDEILSASEEAVTTVDLTHPRGGVTTIKGMRVPARPPPALTPPPPIIDAMLRPTVQVNFAPLPPVAPPAPAAEAAADPATEPAPAAASAAAAAFAAAEAAASAAAASEATDRDAPALAAASDPPLPAAVPSPRNTPPRPAAGPGLPQLTPSVPSLAPAPTESTLIGTIANPRQPAQPAQAQPAHASRGSRPRMPPNGTPQSLSRVTSNLRDAYPTIHRSPPSPLHHQPSAFDDRSQSSVGGPVFRARKMPRDMFVWQLVLGVAIATAILVVFLLLTW